MDDVEAERARLCSPPSQRSISRYDLHVDRITLTLLGISIVLFVVQTLKSEDSDLATPSKDEQVAFEHRLTDANAHGSKELICRYDAPSCMGRKETRPKEVKTPHAMPGTRINYLTPRYTQRHG